MVLHELGTNSRKYGAFSNTTGTVTVEWTVTDRILQLTWLEQGGPAVAAPIKHGFGSSVISEMLLLTMVRRRCIVQLMGSSGRLAGGFRKQVSPKLIAITAQSLRLVSEDNADPTHRDHLTDTLTGKRILVVEDEVVVGLNVISALEEANAIPVGPCCSIDEALEVIEIEKLDAALLDANLRGMSVEEIAAALTRRGIPFAFVTGYGRTSLPVAFQSAPILAKPFTSEVLLGQARKLVSLSGNWRWSDNIRN